VKFAFPDRRVIVITGDGAFQETVQAVSSHNYYKQNTVVFVLVNGIYGVEQKIVNPNPFRTPPIDYKDPLLNNVYEYNHLAKWDYAKAALLFGGVGKTAKTVSNLESILKEVDADQAHNYVVEIDIPIDDVPSEIKGGLNTPGEDENENANFPPGNVY